jgi:hypothetical protein
MHDLFRLHVLFRQTSHDTAWRYTLVEDLASPRFAVLHADSLGSYSPEHAAFLERNAIERIVEADMSILIWRDSLAGAVTAHDEDFGMNWAAS